MKRKSESEGMELSNYERSVLAITAISEALHIILDKLKTAFEAGIISKSIYEKEKETYILEAMQLLEEINLTNLQNEATLIVRESTAKGFLKKALHLTITRHTIIYS